MLNKQCVCSSVLWILVIAVAAETEVSELGDDANITYCKFKVKGESLRYWRGKMAMQNPDAIHFTLRLNHSYTVLNTGPTKHLIRPLDWTWTFNEEYLHWPLDHGLLSFHLLDSKTLYIPYIQLVVTSSSNCSVVLDSPQTTENIVQALIRLVQHNATQEEKQYPEHDNHFFCYLHFDMSQSTWEDFAALYLKYPLALILKNYRCSHLAFNYNKNEFVLKEYKHDTTGVWALYVMAPYAFGVLIYMYFPILMLEICAWLSREERLEIPHNHYTEITDDSTQETDDTEWIMLNGSPPLTFLETFALKFTGLRKKHPHLTSRIVRFCGLIIIPLLMLPQLMMYRKGVNKQHSITIEDLMLIGNPSNFLGLLSSDVSLMSKRFVPCLGGPIGVLVIYFVLGLMFIVLPRSLKQVLENGIPKSKDWSPLFLSGEQIITLSGVNVHKEPGYQKAAAVCKCSMYLLANPKFWGILFSTQRQRFLQIYFSHLHKVFKLFLYTGLMVLSLLEMVLCVIVYGFPLFGCLCMTMTGAIVSISNTRFTFDRKKYINRKVALAFIYMFVVVSWVLLAYCIALIFLQVFMFVSQVALFCFVAIFTYPSVSFGYLFFYIVLVFYILRNIAEFSDTYYELLQTAVDVSIEIDAKINDVVVEDDCLYICNFVNCFKRISLNGIPIDMSTQAIASMGNQQFIPKTICKQGAYGIPKELFYKLVAEHKPIHAYMLNLFIKFVLLAFFVKFAWDVTSRTVTGPTTEISEVMHVIFVVVLSAVPKMVEVALFHENKTVHNEIGRREITKTIKTYWFEKQSKKPRVSSNGQILYQRNFEKQTEFISLS